MNHIKSNPTGIDEPIQRLQSYLYEKINIKFNLTDFEGYGRVYKNKKNSLIIPEFYVSEKEYKEVLLDDRISGIMFFVPSDIYKSNGGYIVRNCDILFTFNLSILTATKNATRDDEEVRNYILQLLHFHKNNIDYKVSTGLNNVYSGFTGVANYFLDMQPFHHFKITTQINYNIHKC